jgi:hypothetical protein
VVKNPALAATMKRLAAVHTPDRASPLKRISPLTVCASARRFVVDIALTVCAACQCRRVAGWRFYKSWACWSVLICRA